MTLVVNTDEVLVASSTNPANTGPEFIASARQRKDGATMRKPSRSWKAALPLTPLA